MSKSDPSDQSRITLTDTADAISRKIRRAKTDAEVLPSETEGLEGRPEAANLVGIFAALSDQTAGEVLRDYGGRGFGDFKPALSDLTIEKLAPISDEMRHLMADPCHIDAILAEGSDRAREVTEPIIAQINEIVGLISA
tara:strand:- start:621 stop:1037 length:417 start_codon:yes stop_codon:yes gene_type:complete